MYDVQCCTVRRVWWALGDGLGGGAVKSPSWMWSGGGSTFSHRCRREVEVALQEVEEIQEVEVEAEVLYVGKVGAGRRDMAGGSVEVPYGEAGEVERRGKRQHASATGRYLGTYRTVRLGTPEVSNLATSPAPLVPRL